MNRIILIGNGFDKAHNLPTSYKDFIDYFWRKLLKKVRNTPQKYEDEFISFSTNGQTLAHIISQDKYNYKDIKPQISSFERSTLGNRTTVHFNLKNRFLERISDLSVENWVDIETEYYNFLNYFISQKPNLEHYFYESISKLNADFKNIKNELEYYLHNVWLERIKRPIPRIEEIILSDFNPRDFTQKGIEYIAKEEAFKIKNIGREDWTKLSASRRTHDLSKELGSFELEKIEEILKQRLIDPNISSSYLEAFPNDTLFLNFNYTDTEELYLNCLANKDVIHIHGELNNEKNPIIFGYGDEIGKEYLEIENLNNNEFLENVKSIKYLETENYKKILNFVESNKYQIFIFGHSCGNSDRTLLNTLFEHENCVSIKVYYYQKSETEDNYSDVARNISRNFNDKKLMREKVVNKMYCEPLVKL